MSKSPADHRYSVRIIGGRWRGRRLRIPRGTAVRPTPDRVRETLFNWLASELPGASCLDLFAGSGALGLEALSRGAREVWLVERDPALARALRAHVKDLDTAAARIVQADARSMLGKSPQASFDVVFIDPPYAQPLETLLSDLEPWLADTAQIYVERAYSNEVLEQLERLPGALPGCELARQSRAAGVVFGLLHFCRDDARQSAGIE